MAGTPTRALCSRAKRRPLFLCPALATPESLPSLFRSPYTPSTHYPSPFALQVWSAKLPGGLQIAWSDLSPIPPWEIAISAEGALGVPNLPGVKLAEIPAVPFVEQVGAARARLLHRVGGRMGLSGWGFRCFALHSLARHSLMSRRQDSGTPSQQYTLLGRQLL